MSRVLDEVHSCKSATSATMFQEAGTVIPGGVTANIKHFAPYPIFMKKGHGSKLVDVDDTEYIDYSLCYGSLITGHGHPKITDATIQQIQESGTVIFGTPHELEITMAKKIKELYPSMEQTRFTNSGTESILLAMRLAIAYTGKSKIGKFEGHYHGGLNEMLVSVNPSEDKAGDIKSPKAVIESSGIPEEQQNQTIVLPFNDLEASEKILRKYQNDLAAIILEPIQGGFIPADKEFIHGLKKITDELNIVLIFDEVKTGFRVALGGAQSNYEIKPDLTTLGKVLGGGMPVGAVGGRKEIMMLSAANNQGDVFSAGANSDQTEQTVFHSGTYNGHPLVLKAGLATIQLLEEELVLEDLFSLTMLLRKRLEALYAKYKIDMKTVGVGSIFNIVITKNNVRNYRDMLKADVDLREKVDIELLNLGIYLKPLNRYSLSISHTIEDINKTVNAHETAIKRVLYEKSSSI